MKPLIRRIASLILGVLLVAAVGSCDRTRSSDDIQVVWKMSRRNASTVATNGSRTLMASDLQCFFVSVKGLGIQPSFKDGDLGTANGVSCLALGQVSKPASLSTATESGVTLRVRPGTERTLRVMGLNNVTAAQCDIGTVGDLIRNNATAELYELGSSVVNVNTDMRVDIQNTFDGAANQTDLLSQCRQAQSGTGTTRTFLYTSIPAIDSVRIDEIDETTGVLTYVNSQVLATTTTPYNICVHPNQRLLAAVASTPNQVYMYQIGLDGALTLAAGSPFVTNGTTAKDCEFSPDGKWLFVKHYSSPGEVAAFGVDANTGATTTVSGSPFTVGNYPTALRVSPNSDALFIGYFGSSLFGHFSINTTTGVVGSVGVVATVQPVSALVFHPLHTVLYSIQSAFGAVSFHSFDVNTNTVGAENVVAGSSEQYSDGCITPDGKYLYMLNKLFGPSDTIARHIIGAGQILTAGNLTSPHYSFPADTDPVSCAITADSKRMYVAGNADFYIHTFSIDTSTGTLTLDSTKSTTAGPTQVAIASVPQ